MMMMMMMMELLLLLSLLVIWTTLLRRCSRSALARAARTPHSPARKTSSLVKHARTQNKQRMQNIKQYNTTQLNTII